MFLQKNILWLLRNTVFKEVNQWFALNIICIIFIRA